MTPHAKAFLKSRHLSKEDSWFCELCSKPSMVVDLSVHHIRYRSLRGGDEPENLISLCAKCHRRVHAENTPEEELRERVKGILDYLHNKGKIE